MKDLNADTIEALQQNLNTFFSQQNIENKQQLISALMLVARSFQEIPPLRRFGVVTLPNSISDTQKKVAEMEVENYQHKIRRYQALYTDLALATSATDKLRLTIALEYALEDVQKAQFNLHSKYGASVLIVNQNN